MRVKNPVNFIFHLFLHVSLTLSHQFFVLSHLYLKYFLIFHISKMFACSHSFSELPFLHKTSTDFDDLITDVREFIEYQLSPHSIAENHHLFNTLSSSVDNRFSLSVIHDLIVEDGFSFRDLQDVFEVTPMKYIRRLGVTHFYLSFRLHTIYWAILINLESILASHYSEENHHPWIDLTTLLDDHRLITSDVPLIIRALSSNAPRNIEPKLTDNIMQVRITPDKDHYVNPFNRHS